MKNILLPNLYSRDQLFTYCGLEGATHYWQMLTLLSRKERFSYCPVWPERNGTIRIPDYQGEIVVASDFADFGPNRMLLADDCNLLIDGEAAFEEIDPAIYTVLRKNGKILFAVKGFERPEFLDADYEALHAKKLEAFQALEKFPVPEDDPAAAHTIARAWSLLRGCIYAPEGKMTGFWCTPDRWPHRACWIMDSVYQALGVRYFNRQAAVDAVFALFANQKESGKIPMNATPFDSPTRVQTQQPIIAAGLKSLEPSCEEIAAAYPHLKAFLNWLWTHRDCDDDGLFEWITSAANKLCPCGESGMDNSPRFDGRSVYAAVDLCSFISRECEVLSEFAGILHLDDDQKLFAERHENLNRLIEERLWNEELQFYTDRECFLDKQTDVIAVSGFLPLICGAASREHAAILASHVRNPKTFGTFYPLPSVSLSDPRFEKDMWRGPVWHIFNYHAAEGLDRYGYHEEAQIIRRKTVEASIRYYNEFGGFFEFYDPEGIVPPGLINRKGPNHPDDFEAYHRAVHDYGWSASIFLDMYWKTHSKKA